jgi:Methylamine utilisation protein MauE
MTGLVATALIVAAAVYATAAAQKLRSRRAYRAFRTGLGESGLLPGHLLAVAAAALAGCEVAVAGLTSVAALTTVVLPGSVAAPGICAAALASAALLTGGLASGIAVVVRHGTKVRCLCFGPGSGRMLGWASLARNTVLLALTSAGLVGSLVSQGHGPPGLTGSLSAVAAGAVAAVALIRFDDLIALFAPIPAPSARTTRPAPHQRRPS